MTSVSWPPCFACMCCGYPSVPVSCVPNSFEPVADDDFIEECYKTVMCSEWEFICDDWKTEHCPSRRLGELPKLEDAFEGIDTFVKERTHGRRLGKCSQ